MLRSILTTCLLAAATVALGAEISLHDTLKSRGPLVRLGDVADVTGHRAEKLRDLPLMPSPAPGDKEFLSSRAIREMLAAQGESVNMHQFTGAYFVEVSGQTIDEAAQRLVGSRPARNAAPNAFRVRNQTTDIASRQARTPSYTPQQLQGVVSHVSKAIQAELDREFNQADADERFAVANVQLSRTAIRRLAERSEEEILVHMPATPEFGPGEVSIRVKSDGAYQPESFRAAIDVVRQPMRIVATEPMARGSIIVASKVRREPTPLKELNRQGAYGYARTKQAIGREAKRPLRVGEALSDLNTAPPVIVKKDEEVTVSSGGGGVRVRLRAIAKQEGRMGDLVPIETVDSGEEFTARVTGPNSLSVLSGGLPTGSGFSYRGGL